MKTKYLEKILYLVTTLFFIWLISGFFIYGRVNLPHDDTWMVERAENILSGEWLGPYSHRTLIKGCVFPVFLAISSFLQIPYLTAVAIFYAISVITFIYVIKDFIKNKWMLYFLYVGILFSTAMFEMNYIQRVYRTSIISAEVLMIFSCYFAMYLNRNNELKKILPWAIISGIYLGLFCNTREDSI